MKTTKQRIEQLKRKGHGEGKYLLQAIPNTEEGINFIKMVRKHLNRDYFKHYTQGRMDEGTWSHSITPSQADHLVLYVSPKEGQFFRQVEQSINQKLLLETERKTREIRHLKEELQKLNNRIPSWLGENNTFVRD